jgi:hypothetical protein
MRIDDKELHAVLPTKKVHSSKFAFSRTGIIFLAHSANFLSSPAATTSSSILSNDNIPSVNPAKRADRAINNIAAGHFNAVSNSSDIGSKYMCILNARKRIKVSN